MGYAGSERDEEIDKEAEKKRDVGREGEPGGLISDYKLALSKHKIFLHPKDRRIIQNKIIGIKHREL